MRKPITEFDGYEVDDTGRVFTCPRVKTRSDGVSVRVLARERKSRVNTANGYAMIQFRRDGKAHTVYVHRLVALAFCEGHQPGLWVNHKNGNKLDNRVENLEWTTSGENNAHKYRTLNQPHPMAGVRGAACKYSTAVEGFDPVTGSVVASFAAMKDAQRSGDYKAGAICRCVKSGRTHRGLRWRLASSTTTSLAPDVGPSKTPGYTQP